MSGIKFAADNPEITMIGNWLFKNRNHPIYDEIMNMGLENTQNIFTELLKLAISRDEIRDDIDFNFVSHAISSMNISAMEYHFQSIKGKEIDMQKFDESIIGTVDLLINFIKYGIGTKKKGGSGND